MLDLLTPKQVADLLQIKTQTLEVWRSKHVGPAWIKLGVGKRSPIRYRLDDIEAYIKPYNATGSRAIK